MITAEEIESQLGNNWGNLLYEEAAWDAEDKDITELVDSDGIRYALTLEGNVGGGEGSGENCWVVIRLTAPDGSQTLWQRHGHYQSFEGTSWGFSMVRQVEAVTVSVTEYRVKK